MFVFVVGYIEKGISCSMLFVYYYMDRLYFKNLVLIWIRDSDFRRVTLIILTNVIRTLKTFHPTSQSVYHKHVF